MDMIKSEYGSRGRRQKVDEAHEQRLTVPTLPSSLWLFVEALILTGIFHPAQYDKHQAGGGKPAVAAALVLPLSRTAGNTPALSTSLSATGSFPELLQRSSASNTESSAILSSSIDYDIDEFVAPYCRAVLSLDAVALYCSI